MTVTSLPTAERNEVSALSPIAPSERIEVMDILRGLALVGILMMNIEWFGRSILSLGSFDNSLTGLDHAVGWLVRCFVEGKFYKIFALLFGMGFAVMLLRAKETGRPYTAWFVRRMVVLYCFGLLHLVFLWGGDILHDYAFAGLMLLGWTFLLKAKRFQKYDNPDSILKIGLIWLAIPTLFSVIAGFGFGIIVDRQSLTEIWQQEQYVATLVEEKLAESGTLIDSEKMLENEILVSPEFAGDANTSEDSEQVLLALQVNDLVVSEQEFVRDENQEIIALTEGSYWQATQYRFGFAGLMLMLSPVFALSMYLPIFLLGYWLISSGILKDHQQHQSLFKPMAWIGLGFGLSVTVGGLLVIQHPAAENAMLLLSTGNTLFFLGQYITAAGYLGLVVSLLGSKQWNKRLSWFAPLGRMALTNYIMHSVILTSIFYGYAGGLYGHVTRAPQMLIVFVIIVFQLFFSTWWLKHYRFGPLEWLWRSLTYKQWQTMRISCQ